MNSYGPDMIWVFLTAVGRGVLRGAADSQAWLDQLREVLRSSIGPPLKAMHEPIDNWLGSLPMWVAMACAVGLYVVAVVWVWGLRREFVFRGAPDQRWYRDLRIWATLVVVPYVAVYVLLGR